MHPSGTQIVGNGVTRVPFLWSTGGWSALLANNQLGIGWQDEGGRLTWTVPGRALDLYVSTAKDGYGLLDAYSRLTGRAPIPPRWTFGFMMSRWGYGGAADIREKWHRFRDMKIPVDAFIYDYDWFRNDWEFNLDNFPAGSLATMKGLGLRFVGIRKPRVNDANRDYAVSRGWTMASSQGTDLKFDIPAAREWWWSKQLPLLRAGVDGWWNDEAEQTYDEFFYMTQTQYEGGRKENNRRVWSLNRAFAPGMSRFGAALWTGDIDSNWETMANQPGTILNWSLAGNPFVGQDLGGFIGQPSAELYARWMQQGVFQPMMRAHGMLDLNRWPWAFGDDVLASTKKAIELRSRLIPYLYTLAERSSATGAPMMRPLFMEFPNDARTFDLRDQWLLGDRLLAAPVLTQATARDVYLPAGRWYDFQTGAAVEGGTTRRVDAPLDAIPAYVRAGTILPLGPVIQSTSLPQDGALEIRVYPGANATFTLYEDDGDTYAYEKGAASRITFRWDDRRRTLTVAARKGSYPGMLAKRRLTVVLPTGVTRSVEYTGREVRVNL
jgi:alpha-glucosidase